MADESTTLQTAMRDLCDKIGITSVARDIGWIDKTTDKIEELMAYKGFVPPTKKRKFIDSDSSDESDDDRKKQKVESKEKGLRHFSKKVCEKVASKRETTYNEVADELVLELNEPGTAVDSKNIRRRVYDALNVLMAINIIEKQKKEITWKGLPTQDTKKEIERLRQEKQERQQRIFEKQEYLAELELQERLCKKLTARNKNKKEIHHSDPPEQIFLPFIAVVGSKDSVIHCSASKESDQYLFDFSLPFSLYDSYQLLKQMNLLEPPVSTLGMPTEPYPFQSHDPPQPQYEPYRQNSRFQFSELRQPQCVQAHQSYNNTRDPNHTSTHIDK